MVKVGIEVKISSNGKEVDVFEIRKDSTKAKIQNSKLILHWRVKINPFT